tara:strand:- start:418 stop:621 length:204 start_codon:yes stop_codon:yes gene_type:complete
MVPFEQAKPVAAALSGKGGPAIVFAMSGTDKDIDRCRARCNRESARGVSVSNSTGFIQAFEQTRVYR